MDTTALIIVVIIIVAIAVLWQRNSTKPVPEKFQAVDLEIMPDVRKKHVTWADQHPFAQPAVV